MRMTRAIAAVVLLLLAGCDGSTKAARGAYPRLGE